MVDLKGVAAGNKRCGEYVGEHGKYNLDLRVSETTITLPGDSNTVEIKDIHAVVKGALPPGVAGKARYIFSPFGQMSISYCFQLVK